MQARSYILVPRCALNGPLANVDPWAIPDQRQMIVSGD